MKKIFILSIVATLFCSISYAKIWRINNNPGIAANFTTAQEANDNVSVLAGDTIHLEPSITNYGSLTCTKRLIWISTGSFLDIHPGEQFSQNAGKIFDLNAYTPGCENSIFHIWIVGSANLGAQGIKLERSLIQGSLWVNDYSNGATATDVIIINCFAPSGVFFITTGNNVIVSNNIIGNGIYVFPTTTLAVITNNVINAVYDGVYYIDNSIVGNNIFNKASSGYAFNNCTVSNNMSGAPGVLPAGNNNQNNITMSTVFEDDNGMADTSFILKAGSPAKGAGSGGADLGAFGGSSPFKLAMQPAVPAIYKMEAPAVPSGNTMNVIFSTKSNN